MNLSCELLSEPNCSAQDGHEGPASWVYEALKNSLTRSCNQFNEREGGR